MKCKNCKGAANLVGFFPIPILPGIVFSVFSFDIMNMYRINIGNHRNSYLHYFDVNIRNNTVFN